MKNLFKRVLSVILVTVTLIPLIPATGLTVSAATYSGKCGGNLTWSLDTSTGVLNITGTGDMENYSYSSAPWYSYRSSIEILEIGNSVTSIGNYAFSECTLLTSVTIGCSVKSIGSYAFYYCNSLKSVTIGNSVTNIYHCAFYYCRSLTSVIIPESVTSIGENAFHYYTSGYKPLNITIRCNENSYAHTYAVNNGINCKFLNVVSGECGDDLTWSLNTSTGVFTIDGTGNMNNYNYTGWNTVPWRDYYSYIKSVVIGDFVTSIGDYAFYECNFLESVNIPDSVTSIGYQAFAYCYALLSVTIGNSVTNIDDEAFFFCTSLTSVIIPDSVTNIGSYLLCCP